MAVVVDAGPLYAYVDADDQHHEACADLLETIRGPLIAERLGVDGIATVDRRHFTVVKAHRQLALLP